MIAGRVTAIWIVLAGLAVILTAPGCAFIDTNDNDSITIGDDQLPVQPTTVPVATYTLEVREEGKKPEIKKLPLSEPTTVQATLVQNGLTKRFRRMNLDMGRVAKGERHKLEMKYDHAKKMVNPLYDYAIHPGDHLVVIEDTSTVLDDMIESVSKPLGLPTASRKGR